MNWSGYAVKMSTGDAEEGHLLITASTSGDEPRTPVVVNLALDRSGSMKGAPLSAAVEAAIQFVELAGPQDFVGLVLFDGVAEQRVPVCAMDSRGKRAMSDALHGIQTGRGTALLSALETAARGLQRTLVPGRRQRILILTDGEPSVGPDQPTAFSELAEQLAKQNMSVHALGLAKHYYAEILHAMTAPTGNAFEHVDGPEGLSEAFGATVARLFGQAASDVRVRIKPQGFLSLTCRHAYPAQIEGEELVVTLGDVSRGFGRRLLMSGALSSPDWGAAVAGQSTEQGDLRRQTIELVRVAPESREGELIRGLHHELELVAAETAAWLSLARKDVERAEVQLEESELHLRQLVSLSPEGIPVKRHVERLSDLRLAVERGEGDIPLLIRRAQSVKAGTHVSQVIPLQGAPRGRKN